MPFRSKAQQRFMFAQHPRIAKRWARKMKREGQSIRALPEKTARDALAPAGYWYGRSTIKRLEGGTQSGTHADKNLPKAGFGTMYGTGLPKKAFDEAFSDELCKIAAGPSRTRALRAAMRAAPFAAKKIKGVRRRFRTLRRKKR